MAVDFTPDPVDIEPTGGIAFTEDPAQSEPQGIQFVADEDIGIKELGKKVRENDVPQFDPLYIKEKEKANFTLRSQPVTMGLDPNQPMPVFDSEAIKKNDADRETYDKLALEMDTAHKERIEKLATDPNYNPTEIVATYAPMMDFQSDDQAGRDLYNELKGLGVDPQIYGKTASRTAMEVAMYRHKNFGDRNATKKETIDGTINSTLEKTGDMATHVVKEVGGLAPMARQRVYAAGDVATSINPLASTAERDFAGQEMGGGLLSAAATGIDMAKGGVRGLRNIGMYLTGEEYEDMDIAKMVANDATVLRMRKQAKPDETVIKKLREAGKAPDNYMEWLRLGDGGTVKNAQGEEVPMDPVDARLRDFDEGTTNLVIMKGIGGLAKAPVLHKISGKILEKTGQAGKAVIGTGDKIIKSKVGKYAPYAAAILTGDVGTGITTAVTQGAARVGSSVGRKVFEGLETVGKEQIAGLGPSAPRGILKTALAEGTKNAIPTTVASLPFSIQENIDDTAAGLISNVALGYLDTHGLASEAFTRKMRNIGRTNELAATGKAKAKYVTEDAPAFEADKKLTAQDRQAVNSLRGWLSQFSNSEGRMPEVKVLSADEFAKRVDAGIKAQGQEAIPLETIAKQRGWASDDGMTSYINGEAKGDVKDPAMHETGHVAQATADLFMEHQSGQLGKSLKDAFSGPEGIEAFRKFREELGYSKESTEEAIKNGDWSERVAEEARELINTDEGIGKFDFSPSVKERLNTAFADMASRLPDWMQSKDASEVGGVAKVTKATADMLRGLGEKGQEVTEARKALTEVDSRIKALEKLGDKASRKEIDELGQARETKAELEKLNKFFDRPAKDMPDMEADGDGPTETTPRTPQADPYSDVGLDQSTVDGVRDNWVAPKGMEPQSTRTKKGILGKSADKVAVERGEQFDDVLKRYSEYLRENEMLAPDDPAKLEQEMIEFELGKMPGKPAATPIVKTGSGVLATKKAEPVSSSVTKEGVLARKGQVKPTELATEPERKETAVAEADPEGEYNRLKEKLSTYETQIKDTDEYKSKRNEKTRAEFTKKSKIKLLSKLVSQRAFEKRNDDLIRERTDEDTGKRRLSGRLDMDIPEHRMIAEEVGLSPEEVVNIQSIQGGTKYIDYNSKFNLEPEDITGKQRRKEYEGDRGTLQKNKAIIGASLQITSTGKPIVKGISGDKVITNISKLMKAGRDHGLDIGYKDINDPAILEDLSGYIQNHRNGYKGDGSGPVEGETPKAGTEPYRIEKNRFPILNAAFNFDVSTTNTPKGQAARETAILNKRRVDETGDTNPFRALINKSGKFVETNKKGETRSGSKEILEPVWENLDPKEIKAIRNAPVGETDIVREAGFRGRAGDAFPEGRGPDSKKVAAGFMPESPIDRAVEPTKDTPSEEGYVYHASNRDRVHEIVESKKLETFKPDYGTDQSLWPDGSTRKRSYWSNSASKVWSFAPEEGKPVILRSKKGDHFKDESGTYDIYTENKIPTSELEILTDEGWKPLAEPTSTETKKGILSKRGKAKEPEKEDLVVTHNLSIGNLKHALKMGGLAVPSLAVIRNEVSKFDSFGEVTLVGDSKLIDPKRDKDAKVFNADVYSPRYPSTEIRFDYNDGKKIADLFRSYHEELDGIIETGNYSWGLNSIKDRIEDRGWNEVGYNDFAKYAYGREKGLIEKPAKGTEKDKFKESIYKLKIDNGELGDWVKKKIEDAGITYKDRIFDGFTNSGNRRYLEHNLDNVVRVMKRGLQDAEGFNYGVPSIRAKVAKKYGTIEALKKDRNQVIDKEAMEKLKKETSDEFEEIGNSLSKLRENGNRTFILDTISDDLKALAEGGSENWKYLRESYGDHVTEFAEKARPFLDKLRNMPTEYFEVKMRRPVGVHEFLGAAIPDDAPEDLVKSLSKRGVFTEKYAKGDNDSRAAAVKKLSEDLKANFMPEAPWKEEREYKGDGGMTYADLALNGNKRNGLITVEKDPDKGWRVRNIFVDEKLGRKGLATAGYEALNEESLYNTGKPLRSSEIGYEKKDSKTTMSEDAVKLWESLVDEGKAIKQGNHYKFVSIDGQPVATGKPISFQYTRRKKSATDIFGVPDKESPFDRGYEPSGKYINTIEGRGKIDEADPNIENGRVWFDNPLVIRGGTYGEPSSWKRVLSKKYDNKTGKELSKALIKDGYDGVITVDRQGPTEILDLTSFDAKKAKFMPAIEDGFHSKLEETIELKMGGRATADQLKGMLRGAKLKDEELKWTGIIPFIDEFAAKNGGKVTKEAVLEHLRGDGKVRFEEKVLGGNTDKRFEVVKNEEESEHAGEDIFDVIDKKNGLPRYTGDREGADQWLEESKQTGDSATRFGDYQLPGGENYKETILAIPTKPPEKLNFEEFLSERGIDQSEYDEATQKQKDDIVSAFEGWELTKPSRDNFKSSHFQQEGNYVAHMRTNERTDAEGAEGLFIEEIQSDRHQRGREEGYKNDSVEFYLKAKDGSGNNAGPYKTRESAEFSNDGTFTVEQRQRSSGVPDAPYRKDWGLQMFKRALRDAVESGKQWIGWTTGETQSERYDLSKQVDSVEWAKYDEGRVDVFFEKRGASGREKAGRFKLNELEGVVGKELAGKIIGEFESGSPNGEYTGTDLKVGGEGMKGFYDNILPKEVEKYVKQWNSKVEPSEIGAVTERNGKVERILDESTDTHRYKYRARSEGGSIIGVFDTLKEAQDAAYAESAEATKIWRVNITPEMKQGIAEKGQPLFMPGKKGILDKRSESEAPRKGILNRVAPDDEEPEKKKVGILSSRR